MMDEEVNELLISTIKENGISEYNITENHGSEKGDGYTGSILNVDIVGRDDEKKETNMHLIVKVIMKFESQQDETPVKVMYDREIYAYKTVFPTLLSFEQEKGQFLPLLIPKFYGGIPGKAVIVENLTRSGYSLHKRNVAMDDRHVCLVMEQYGRLHALSFALRDQKKDKFNAITNRMDSVYKNDILKNSFKHIMIEKCTTAKNALLDGDEDVLKTYEKFLDSIEELIEDLLSDKYCDEHSVILHGDCWTSNLMFKYGDKNDSSRPTQVTLIDMQLMRLGSPVLDLAYFFYTCSDKEIINELHKYLQIYYYCFAERLRNLGSDPEKLFPYSVLKEHWKKFARFGLIFSIWIIYVMLTDETEVVNLSKVTKDDVDDAFKYSIAKLPEYNARVKNIILHFVANDFI